MIPRVIHHIWVGPPMPETLTGHVRTWRDLHPEWDHVLWSSFDDLENQALYDDAESLAPGSEGQLRSDLARYEILYRHGGVYVDCDMEALRPIDDLLVVDCFAGWETDGVWVNNAVVGCVPGHPLMRDLIDAAPASIRRNKGARPNRMTGPHLLTPLIVPRSGVCRADVNVYPSSYFYPYRWDDLDAAHDYGDAYAVHHWSNQRRKRGVPMPEAAHV